MGIKIKRFRRKIWIIIAIFILFFGYLWIADFSGGSTACPMKDVKTSYIDKLFWQKYTNTKYHYLFKYPSGATVHTLDDSKTTIAKEDSYNVSIGCLPGYESIKLSPPFFADKPQTYTNFKDYIVTTYHIKGNKIIIPEAPYVIESGTYNILLFKEYTIGGKPAIKLRFKADPNQGISEDWIIEKVLVEVTHGNIWELSVEGLTVDSNDVLIDQILSTLKFTN